ncbi:MAG TPA: ankyrin repeat domain-containing protein [Verrucomicrobiae bacterium]|nr:ankyrin repeat domain-containing protein [Verrucomicrobiae bacterium]
MLVTLSRQNLAGIRGFAAGDTQPVPVPKTVGEVITDEEEQEIRRIQAMIQNSPDLINASPATSRTPLANAAEKGHVHVATFLINNGANVNQASDGAVPLYYAARAGHKTMVDLLLKHGAEVMARNITSETALHVASARGYKAVVESLIAAKADVNARRAQGRTPLHDAAEGGFVPVAEALIINKADVNARTSHGQNPVHLAAAKGHTEIIAVLLQHGAEADAADQSDSTPLFQAVTYGHLRTVEVLLAAKANPNHLNQGGSPLSIAAQVSLEMVERLLTAGADPNRGSRNLPLSSAIEFGNPERLTICGTLLRAGADPNISAEQFLRRGRIEDVIGPTPAISAIQLAMARKESSLVLLMLKHKADPNTLSLRGQPIIRQAIAERMTDVALALLEAGADPQREDGTVLMFAIAARMQPVVEELIKRGVPINRRFQWNLGTESPLGLAISLKKGEPALADQYAAIADLLRQQGALENPPDFTRITIQRNGAGLKTVFWRGTNDWNHFTLLDAILVNYSHPMSPPTFPDFADLTIIRQLPGTSETRQTLNILRADGTIDCEKNVPLEWGDVIEIPEREHTLDERWTGLPQDQVQSLHNCVKGTVELRFRDKQVFIAVYPFESSRLCNVLESAQAKAILLSSSDLSRVKITRTAENGTRKVWTISCIAKSPSQALPPQPHMGGGSRLVLNGSVPPPDELHLRDGDIIEVPER